MNVDPTREKIIKVASGIFGKYGFQKTTMDEIARTARKAKGSLYYYFNSKEDLFLAVVSREMDTLKEALLGVVEKQDDSSAMIRNYMLTRMKVLRGAVNYHETLKADFIGTFEFLDELRSRFDTFEVELLSGILQKGVDEKSIVVEDVNKTAQVIILAMKAIEIPFYLQNKISEYENTIVELLDILIRGLEGGANPAEHTA
ncbi:MAG: TetR/AcrR family transcriptional regulator [Bacteroidales bacterium]|jgi:AcrR family transcriptional regulator|nr:TetR/AcrR family transcriptional regulator [Bacteroidales bacterium]